jgi:hypothetical protein
VSQHLPHTHSCHLTCVLTCSALTIQVPSSCQEPEPHSPMCSWESCNVESPLCGERETNEAGPGEAEGQQVQICARMSWLSLRTVWRQVCLKQSEHLESRVLSVDFILSTLRSHFH